MTGKILKGRSDFPSVFWNPPPAVQKLQKIRLLLAQNSPSSEEVRSQTHRAWEPHDALSPPWEAALRESWGDALQRLLPLLCSPGALREPAKCILSSQTPCQPTQTGLLSSPPSGAGQQLPPGTSTSRKSSTGENKSQFVSSLPFPGWYRSQNPPLKVQGKRNYLYFSVLSGNTTELMLWLQP